MGANAHTVLEIAPPPPIIAGRGAAHNIPKAAQSLGMRRPLLVIDSFLVGNGFAQTLTDQLAANGLDTLVFAEFNGEPKCAHIDTGTTAALAQASDGVIGIGGGTALDIAKLVACCASSTETDKRIEQYALGAKPLPGTSLPKLLVPTTAGTGSEMSATNIFSGADGRKLWAWAAQSRADMAILDGDLLASMPRDLLVWCAMDAFVHAFEATTNTTSHEGAAPYGHRAMTLIVENLPAAVEGAGDALQSLMIASAWAGVAIDRCGTAIAHMASHALAGLAPIHHGQATALAFEATLPWLLSQGSPALRAAAQACGSRLEELPDRVSRLIDLASTGRQWLETVASISPETLATEMARSENSPMRDRTIRKIGDDDLLPLAQSILMGNTG
ncbi:MAG: iron-containing alcohol dehydrogenase [Pseudomonadota bacterium]